MDILSILTAAGENPTAVLNALVSQIRVKTNLNDEFVIDNPFQAGPPNPYLQSLQPQITLVFSNNLGQVVSAPYGTPGAAPDYSADATSIGEILVGGLLLYALLK